VLIYIQFSLSISAGSGVRKNLCITNIKSFQKVFKIFCQSKKILQKHFGLIPIKEKKFLSVWIKKSENYNFEIIRKNIIEQE